MLERDHAVANRHWRDDCSRVAHEGQAAHLGCELLRAVVAEPELCKDRKPRTVKYASWVRGLVVQVRKRSAGPVFAEVIRCCALDGLSRVVVEKRMDPQHVATISGGGLLTAARGLDGQGDRVRRWAAVMERSGAQAIASKTRAEVAPWFLRQVSAPVSD